MLLKHSKPLSGALGWTTDPATGSKQDSKRCLRLRMKGVVGQMTRNPGMECTLIPDHSAVPLRWELQLHTTGGCNCPTGGAVGEGHCSMAAASPTLLIKGIIRIQTDKKMASDTTYYLITQRPGGDCSRKWNINKNLFHMHCTCHPLNLILKTPSTHNPVQSVTGDIVFRCSNLHLGVKRTITNRNVSSANKRTQNTPFYFSTFCLVCKMGL